MPSLRAPASWKLRTESRPRQDGNASVPGRVAIDPPSSKSSNRIRPRGETREPRPVLHGLPRSGQSPRTGKQANFARPTAACQRGSSRTVTRSRPWSTSLPLDKTTGTKWRGTRTPAAVTRAPPSSPSSVPVERDDPEHEQPWSTRRAARPVLSTPAG